MANTRSLSETVKADLEMSAEFRGALLSEAVACMLSGDVETGKIVLREYVNGTIGFLKLGAALGRSNGSPKPGAGKYNVSRPHRPLDYRTLEELASQIAARRDLATTQTSCKLILDSAQILQALQLVED